MKKSKLILTLALLAPTFSMTSCANTQEAVAYGIYNGSSTSKQGNYICKVDVKVFDGKISSASIEETYSPNLWARVAEANKDKVATIPVTTDSETLYIAKYINIGNTVWVGELRTEDDTNYNLYNYGEYVKYTMASLIGTSDSSSGLDLVGRYLVETGASTYKLYPNANEYYSAVVGGNISIGSYANNTYTASTEVVPTFPNNSKVKTDTAWKTSTEALCTYMTGKRISYTDGSTNGNGTYWTISKSNITGETGSDVITNCSVNDVSSDAIKMYLYAINEAFASVEYASKS